MASTTIILLTGMPRHMYISSAHAAVVPGNDKTPEYRSIIADKDVSVRQIGDLQTYRAHFEVYVN